MKIKNYVRGDSRNIVVQVYQSDGVTPLSLVGATVFFTVNANNAPSDDSAAVISKTVTSHSDPTNGKTTIALTNTNTQNITPGTYYYDVQVKDAGGNILSQVQDTFVVIADITRRIV
jgi:hypothetical protein